MENERIEILQKVANGELTPEQEIKDDDGNDIYIAGSGCVPKDYAEHIVKLHNTSLNGS